jgi:hypothetical protein
MKREAPQRLKGSNVCVHLALLRWLVKNPLNGRARARVCRRPVGDSVAYSVRTPAAAALRRWWQVKESLQQTTWRRQVAAVGSNDDRGDWI